MVRLNALVAVVAVPLLLAGGSTCGFYRRTVLADPVRFEKGFSFSRSFTVDVPAKYDLTLRLHKIPTKPDAWHPVPNDDFLAQFEILAEGQIVVQGTNSAIERNHGVSFVQRGYTTYVLGTFTADPAKKYQLRFRIYDAASYLASTQPILMVIFDPFQLKHD